MTGKAFGLEKTSSHRPALGESGLLMQAVVSVRLEAQPNGCVNNSSRCLDVE